LNPDVLKVPATSGLPDLPLLPAIMVLLMRAVPPIPPPVSAVFRVSVQLLTLTVPPFGLSIAPPGVVLLEVLASSVLLVMLIVPALSLLKTPAPTGALPPATRELIMFIVPVKWL
jgi:hypothetical protein